MKKIIMSTAILGVMFFTTITAEAQSRSIQQNQQYRIQEGVRHGKLTRNETRTLHMQQAQIAQMKRMAMADGRISPQEKLMIAKAERRADRNIYIQKNDRQRRF